MKSKLWQAFLAVSISALTVPAFVQSQATSDKPSSGSGMSAGAGSTGSSGMKSGAGSESGTKASGAAGEATGSSRTMGSPSSPGSSMGSSAAMGAGADQAITEADRTLNQNIRQALMADSSLGASSKNVHFKTDNGKVTLHGTVATEKDKKDIEAKVEKMTGVKDVDNQLQIGPASPSAGGSMGSGSKTEPTSKMEPGASKTEPSASAKGSAGGAMDR